MAEVRNVLDGHHVGLSFLPGDSDSLAEQIIKLLNHPAMREEMARAARPTVIAHYSWSIKVKELKETIADHLWSQQMKKISL
jgi:glycosyltransferase involved in cell wall biosynthesis